MDSIYYSPCGEGPLKRILDVDDIETSNVLLSVHDDTSPAHVASTGDHDDVACVEFDEVGDFALLEVELDSVVGTNMGVGVTNGATIVGDNVGDTTVTNGDAADLQEFVGSFLWGDAVDGEATLNIVQETEMFARFFDGDDI